MCIGRGMPDMFDDEGDDMLYSLPTLLILEQYTNSVEIFLWQMMDGVDG